MNLLFIANLKALAHKAYMTEVKQRGNTVKMTMYERAKINPAGIPPLLTEYNRQLEFKVEKNPYFLFQIDRKKIHSIRELLEKILFLVQE